MGTNCIASSGYEVTGDDQPVQASLTELEADAAIRDQAERRARKATEAQADVEGDVDDLDW
jgi:hypothetical protein